MTVFLTLFRQFIWRALVREKLRSVITVLGISLGVGVAVAIRLANVGALESFRAATDSVAGETSIQITGSAGRFDEMVLADLGWLRSYGQVSPVITGFAKADLSNIDSDSGEAAVADSHGPYLQVLGVDVLRDRLLRRYRLLRVNDNGAEPGIRYLLMLLADPQSIVLTEQFARRHQISIGSRIFLLIGESRRAFVVRGLLMDEGPARALQGNFALLDIAAAQLSFNRVGLLDRIDVKLKSGSDIGEVEREIREKLPDRLRVLRPETGYDQVEKMIAAFQFNLSALGSIALLVGLFLIYNTVSISVITRREEVGSLRAVGTTQVIILGLFLGEALLLTAVGTVVGLGLGRILAGAAVQITATTVETFFIASAATEAVVRHSVGVDEVTLAFAIALPLSIVASAVPALEAARVSPIEAMRGAERLARSFKPSIKHLLLSSTLFVGAYRFSSLDPTNGLPIFGYVAALMLMFGGAFLVPNVLWLACVVNSRWLARLFFTAVIEAKLASANLRASIPRVSISVAALSVALSMMVAVSVMIGSFRDTVSYWVGETMVADIYAKPITRAATTDEGELSDEAIKVAQNDPQIEAVYPFTTQQIIYADEPVTVGAGDFATFLKHGRLLFKAPSDARDQIRDAIGHDFVTVNESFSLRFKKYVGDMIELPTAFGSHEFKIVAIYYDYSSSRGWVVMHQGTYAKHFPYSRPTSMSIYLQPGADAEVVSERLSRAVDKDAQILFATNVDLRREVMRIFDSTFAITYALELIAIVIAALGVISTLITLILERRGEIAVLGFLGATHRQLRRMVVMEALLIGGVSQAIGIAIGLMLSLVLIYVINVQSFGWTIQFHLPLGFLVQSTLIMIGVTAVAGLYPAARAAKTDVVRFARAE
ncbi:MAG TPA: FtsX-like permease family protein [Blastocatellia bacterium]|nr:FtsX-like permease family protein [Blastocatellia bacterium]